MVFSNIASPWNVAKAKDTEVIEFDVVKSNGAVEYSFF
jgi:hypothetical protein